MSIPDMKFIVYDKSQEDSRVAWSGKQLIIGRRTDVDIQINEPTMSGIHAKIFPASDGVRIRDLDSLNGTMVNGVRIVESLLRPGDQIKIGRATILVSGLATEASGEEPTAAIPTFETTQANTQTIKVHLDQLRRGREELDGDEHILLLRNLFESLESAADREDVLRKVRGVFLHAFRRARVFVLRPADDGWSDPEVGTDARRPSLTFAAEAARTNSAILSTSLPDDSRFASSESARISGIETAIASPTSCDGQPVAVLYVDRLGLPPFSRRDLSILGIAANHISAVLENVERIAELRRTNAELREAREGLAELNRDLEQRVQKRTGEIRRQADEIRRLAEAKDELLGIAAHDIRGPLTVIQGTTELLRLRVDELDGNTLRRSLELMQVASRGLGRLLSELLDAKAIESGKITLRRRRSPVRGLIEGALPVARLAAEDKKIDLVVETEDDFLIDADPERLGQAITNLVLNAVKFSASGTRILVRASNGDDGALIEVEDQGVGIPKEELDKIFGPFEQGKAGQAAGGSGLGLMIAKRLVELHGGTLSVKSRIGVGTRFVLALPARAPDANPGAP